MNRIVRLGLLVVVVASLCGCAAAIVGGAAAGGYYVGKDDRSLGEITDDATITASINARYVRDDLIKTFDIDVDTHRGTVYLHGRVASGRTAQRAIDLAGSVKGVRRVVSRLTVAQQ